MIGRVIICNGQRLFRLSSHLDRIRLAGIESEEVERVMEMARDEDRACNCD